MSAAGFDGPDLDTLLAQLHPELSPDQRAQLLAAVGSPFDFSRPEPELLSVPETTRGFRVRVDLLHTKPPVWRRLEHPGDITLPRVHKVLQGAMGWCDSHLHQFRTSNDRNPPAFLTRFDVESEGMQGMLEDDVRLDQVIASKGDRLWYDYDFGDGWEHVLRVEAVLDAPPAAPVCVGGRLACPPEDCGGVWGYSELAAWVRADHDSAHLPQAFESVAAAKQWLPDDWHPDFFDIEETNNDIEAIIADPITVTDELAALLEFAGAQHAFALGGALMHPALTGTTEITAQQAATITESFRILLDVIGDGMALTSAGKLKPAVVTEIATRTGLSDWWIGMANREDGTRPIAQLRDSARRLGLVAVRHGRIAPTQAAKRCEGDPESLLRHIMGRLPLGKSEGDRHAGWISLVVVGTEQPIEAWADDVSALMFDIGWRSGSDSSRRPSGENDTLDALRFLAGSLQTPWLQGGDVQAVATLARSIITA